MNLSFEIEQNATEFLDPERITLLPERGAWENAFRRFRRHRMSIFALSIICFYVLAATFGPMLSSYDYSTQDFSRLDQPPSREHWFGTDELGRDFLVRILLGARTAFFVAIISSSFSYTIGVVVGSVSAFSGGRVDAVLMRVADVFMSFPSLLLAIFVGATIRQPVIRYVQLLYQNSQLPIFSSTVGVDYILVFGSLAVAGWPYSARVIRGQILTLREMDYVAAGKVLGGSQLWIIYKHLIPNAIGPIIVSVTSGFGGAMLAEASLSFLGIGIRAPGASWGAMINESVLGWRVHPHLIVVPGLVLAVLVFAFNTLGDGLNDALNPRSSSRV